MCLDAKPRRKNHFYAKSTNTNFWFSGGEILKLEFGHFHLDTLQSIERFVS